MSKKQVKKQTVKKNQTKKQLRRSSVTLMIGILLLLIPLLVFGGIVLTAYITNFNPVIGSRFAGDLNPKITKEQLKDIETKTKALVNVENCEVVLTTSQLRVNVDANDSISEEEANTLIKEVYDTVNGVTNIYTYFTATSEQKMYDLSIDVYNNLDNDDSLIHLNLTKNSKMSDALIQLLSKAKDEELAKELRGEIVHEETPGGLNVDVDPNDVDQSSPSN